jgi:hypothetical protein
MNRINQVTGIGYEPQCDGHERGDEQEFNLRSRVFGYFVSHFGLTSFQNFRTILRFILPESSPFVNSYLLVVRRQSQAARSLFSK